MQELFPLLIHLEFCGTYNQTLALPSGFLGQSAPRLEGLSLDHISFPGLPTLFLSSRDLVSLKLSHIPLTGYISPEVMVTGLGALTTLETLRLHIAFFSQILALKKEEGLRNPNRCPSTLRLQNEPYSA